MSIENFRELFLRGEATSLTALIEHLSEHPAAGWARQQDTEKRARLGGEETIGPFCFVRTPEDESLVAALWLYPKGSGQLYVSNIVPWVRTELTRAEYNETLIAFYRAMVLPSAPQFGVQAEVTGDQQDIQDLLTARTAEALKLFSALANKSTGAAHPLDRERWEKFLVLCHADHCALQADTLSRWLTESEGWPVEKAWDLAGEYSAAISLLHAYDDFRDFHG